MTRTTLALITLAIATTAAGCGGDSSLTVANESSYVLTEIRIAPIDDPNWGPDLLGGDVLLPGEDLVITNIDCDTYDVLVVDDTDLDCVITDLDLCFDDALWVVDDVDLAICAF
jgi:hypothetical protein